MMIIEFLSMVKWILFAQNMQQVALNISNSPVLGTSVHTGLIRKGGKSTSEGNTESIIRTPESKCHKS